MWNLFPRTRTWQHKIKWKNIEIYAHTKKKMQRKDHLILYEYFCSTFNVFYNRPMGCLDCSETSAKKHSPIHIHILWRYWWQCARSMAYHCPCWLTSCFFLNELIRCVFCSPLFRCFISSLELALSLRLSLMPPIMCLRCALFFPSTAHGIFNPAYHEGYSAE